MKKALIIFVLLFAINASAESLFVDDTFTEIIGEIQGFKNGEFTIMTSGGEITLPKDKIHFIVLDSIRKGGLFSNPKKTFLRWVEAAKEGNIPKMAACYTKGLMFRKIRELSSTDSDKLKEMKKIIGKTKFEISDPLIIGNLATLRVERFYKKTKSESFLEFVIERGEWKIEE